MRILSKCLVVCLIFVGQSSFAMPGPWGDPGWWADLTPEQQIQIILQQQLEQRRLLEQVSNLPQNVRSDSAGKICICGRGPFQNFGMHWASCSNNPDRHAQTRTCGICGKVCGNAGALSGHLKIAGNGDRY